MQKSDIQFVADIHRPLLECAVFGGDEFEQNGQGTFRADGTDGIAGLGPLIGIGT